MAAMDRDTFIPLGTSIAKLLLIAAGQGTLAAAVGEGAGLLARLRGTLEIGGKRAALVEKIADDAAKQLLREHQGVSEADWRVAARQAASLIDRLSEKERLAAGYDWEELRRTLLALGGTDLRRNLDDESARQAFDWVLEVACQRVADCFTEKEALASILESVDEVRSGIQRLADRPAGASQTRAVVADHLEVVRDLTPDPLEDRERELAELTAFVHRAPDTWYAMEAGMISGKTALMSSFTLNPPSDVHIVSFFIRRMGGDGNDWRSFSFVAGAQLAEILGDEYTERVSEPASQDTEFRQLLRRAATACQSDKNPRPLVLVIDGVDEDSYYERPDDAAAKSILSLLPRHLPEGVKLVTASRPNPRMPEDIVCTASRVIASLKPSPIAQEKINQKDIETFFKSDLAVDIGAFLAACRGSLTIDELRQLIARRRHLENVPSRDVKACVDHSPGRMLMRVNVGFSDREIPSYTLGHDAVLRAVLRELAPDLFGENDGVDESAWWAQIRDEVLSPYREVVLKWVVNRAGEGWGRVTPNYMLGDACFDIMLSHDVLVVLNVGRYREVQRRFGRRSRVLRMVDLECSKVLDANRGELPECLMTSLLEVVELRCALVEASIYCPGLFGLYVSCFDIAPDVMLDMVLSIDEPNDRLDVLGEVVKAALESGRGCEFLPHVPVALESVASCRDLRDDILYLLVSILVSSGCVVNNSEVDDCKIVDLDEWVNRVLVSAGMERGFIQLRSLVKGVDDVNKSADVIATFSENIAGRIENAREHAMALVKVAGALARAGITDEALAVAERIEKPQERARALAGVVDALAQAGMTHEALAVAERIEKPQERARALAGVVDALARAGITDEALAVAERIEDRWERARALVGVAGVLVGVGDSDRARRVAEKAASTVERIEDPWDHMVAVLGSAGVLATVAGVLARVAGVLVGVGDSDRARRVAEKATSTVERIEKPRERARALVEVVDALARAGDPDRVRLIAVNAVDAAERIEDRWERARALVGVAGVLVGVGDSDRARRVAEKAASTVERIEKPWERARALVEVVDALVRVGDSDRARRVAEKATSTVERIEKPQERARALVEVTDALARAGITDEALAVAERIEKPWERARALVEVTDALARAGITDEALAVAERIEKPWERARALVEVTDALARAGITDEALAVAERIEKPWERVRALVGVVDALARAGMTHEALAVAERIEDRWERVRALVGVVDALVRVGDSDRARRVAEKAASTAERIHALWERIPALVEVTSALARAAGVLARVTGALAEVGNTDRARRVAETAVSTTERIEDPEARVRALVEVAAALAEVGNTDRARRVAEKATSTAERIEKPQERARALVEVVSALAQAGKTDEALKTISVMNDPSSRSRAQSTVIKTLVRNGSTNDAADAMRVELAWVRGIAQRHDAADYCATLAAACVDSADFLADSADTEPIERERWLGMARSVLARSWLYGASVWDNFDVLVRVAPELAAQLVDERILAGPEQGTAAESEANRGPEGPGGDAGSYR